MTQTDNSRIAVIGTVFALMATLMVFRLVYVQLFQHGHYEVVAKSAHARKFEIPAQRGNIYLTDRASKIPVALNRNLKTLYADTRYIYEPERVVRELKSILKKDFSDSINSDEPYIVLQKEVPLEAANAIEELELSGIGLSDNYVRVYPEGSLAAQTLGFVNAEGEGQYGIEGFLDAELAGTPGLFNAQTDTRGIPIATSDNVQIKPNDGSDVVLTIDRNIQSRVEDVLKAGVEKYGAKLGSVVIMNPNNGEIVAMANYPTYDPNKFNEVKNYSNFINHAAMTLFEPGSGFKVFSMAAGLDTGAVTPESTYYDTGTTRIGEDVIKNAGALIPQTRTMVEVITKSVNTGVVHVLRQLGGGEINLTARQTLYDYFTNRFYLHQKTGIEQVGEGQPALDKPDQASEVRYANMTFGQGLTTTMVRMVSSMAATINGGTLYKPHVIDHTIAPDGTIDKTETQVVAENVISQQTSDQLKAMMETVVQEGGGFGTKISGYRIGGKTGTAQIPNPQGGYFLDRDIGTFIGFAPLQKPEYIMMVRVDEPNVGAGFYAGSTAAGPIFGDIMDWLLKYSGIPPSEGV